MRLNHPGQPDVTVRIVEATVITGKGLVKKDSVHIVSASEAADLLLYEKAVVHVEAAAPVDPPKEPEVPEKTQAQQPEQ